MKSLVSIIVMIYNNKQYIKECLNSILNQSYKNIEIIISDDNSNNFDEKKGFKFSTYAINTMRGYIRTEYFHDKNRFIRKRNDNKEVYEKVNISSLNNTLPLEGKKIEVIENCVSNFEIDNEIEKLDLKIAINKLKNKEKQIIQLLFFEGKTQN